MLNLRRLQTIVLLVAVMGSAFVLFNTFFVQETTAQSGTTQCDIWEAQCKAASGIAYAICTDKGWNSKACSASFGKAHKICQPYFNNCN